MATELNYVKRGIAVIATCMVEALAETDPGFRDRFLAKLERAYDRLKDSGTGEISELEAEINQARTCARFQRKC